YERRSVHVDQPPRFPPSPRTGRARCLRHAADAAELRDPDLPRPAGPPPPRAAPPPCAPPPMRQSFATLTFQDRPAIRLDVAQVEIVQAYKAPGVAPHVDHLFPQKPVAVAARSGP